MTPNMETAGVSKYSISFGLSAALAKLKVEGSSATQRTVIRMIPLR